MAEGDGKRSRRRALARGRRGEYLAAVALMLKGYRIVARRYRTRLGEIDLIARRGHVVAIVEVKARPSLGGVALYPGKGRIEGAADMWLARQRDAERLSLRFDIVAVIPRRWPVHVENAWSGRGM